MNILTLPNLLNNPHTRQSYIINDKEYMFSFRWCGHFCVLDIYTIQDNESVYLVKSRALTADTNVIARVKDRILITGKLFFVNQYGENIEPEQENFHTDFYFVYVSEYEVA